MANVQFSHHKFNTNNSSPVYNIGNTTTTQWNGSEIIGKKSYHQQTNNSMRLDNASSYHCQAQFNNQKSNNFFPTSNHVKHVINSYPSPSQKRKKNVKPSSLSSSLSTSNSFHNSQDFSSRQFNNRSKSHLQQKTFISSSSIPSSHEVSDIISTPSQIPYAPNFEVPAGLPQTLFASRQGECDFQSTSSSSQQHNSLSFTHEQSQIRRLSFESSGGCCCKSLPTKSEGSEISDALQFFVIKLPGMKNFILVPKCTVEKNVHDDDVRVFSPTTKMNVDQSITVKLPGMSNNSVFLCEEPWWLSPKETTDITVPSNEEGVKGNDDDDNDDDDDGDNNNNNIDQGYDNVDDVEEEEEEEEYESARAIEIQFDVTPIVKLPSWGLTSIAAVKLDHKKEVEEYLNDYCHITTSDILEFDKEPPVVRLHPKSTPSTRCNLPNLKIETNLKLDKEEDDDRFPSADCSTLSTPISEVSSTSFSNMSYAESDNTVFTEEEIINESKSCNAPERRSPSVLSDFSSEYLTPVLEEEEEEESKMVSSTSSIEECQQEMTVEEFSESNESIHSPNESENEVLEEYQETQELEDPQENEEQVEYALPELREIAEQLEKLQSDSSEAIRIRRQLEIINRDNYPDTLPLSNKWTMYFADTSVTKINTRVISKNKYSSTLNPIFECTTVPELCSNLREFSSKIKPSDMKTNVNLSFFKGNIMPMWEDEANHKGGRFTLCPPRSQLNSLWNSIVLLLAGEAIDDNNFICGAVCARRDRGDRVELWISGDAHSKAIDHIRDLLADELGYETVKNVKYKKHLGRP